MGKLKLNPFKWGKKMSEGSVTVPLSFWNTIVGVLLAAIVSLLVTMHSAYSHTQDVTVKNKTRIDTVEEELEAVKLTLNQIQIAQTNIQKTQAADTASIQRMEKDISMVLQLLMRKNGLGSGE